MEGLDRMVRIEDDLGPRTDLTHDVQELRVRIHREIAVFQVLADKLWGLDEGVPQGWLLLIEIHLSYTRQGGLEANIRQ